MTPLESRNCSWLSSEGPAAKLCQLTHSSPQPHTIQNPDRPPSNAFIHSDAISLSILYTFTRTFRGYFRLRQLRIRSRFGPEPMQLFAISKNMVLVKIMIWCTALHKSRHLSQNFAIDVTLCVDSEYVIRNKIALRNIVITFKNMFLIFASRMQFLNPSEGEIWTNRLQKWNLHIRICPECKKLQRNCARKRKFAAQLSMPAPPASQKVELWSWKTRNTMSLER